LADSLALVGANFALERLDLWIYLVRVTVLDELLDVLGIHSLVRSSNRVPASWMKAKIRLGGTHEKDVAAAHHARSATDTNHRHQRPVMSQSL